MPNPRSPPDEPIRSWAAFDQLFEKTFAPRDTPVDTPTLSTAELDRPMAPEPFSTPLYSSESSLGPPTPPDYEYIDELWADVRRKTQRSMVGSPSKVKSLESNPFVDPQPTASPKPKKRKSSIEFRESSDGQTVTAIFDLPGVKKQDMHISFQPTRLIVTWQTVRVTEGVDGDRTVRERREKKYSRTIPLPEGAKFEDVRAAMDGRRLILTYPNNASVRSSSRLSPVDLK